MDVSGRIIHRFLISEGVPRLRHSSATVSKTNYLFIHLIRPQQSHQKIQFKSSRPHNMGATQHIDDQVEWDMVLEKTQVVVADCMAHLWLIVVDEGGRDANTCS